MEGAGRVL